MKPHPTLDVWLARLTDAKTDDFPSRAIVCRQNEELTHIGVISAGHVKFSHTDAGGAMFTQVVLGVGSVFGALGGVTRRAEGTAQAYGRCRVLWIAPQALDDALAGQPGLAAALVRQLAKQNRLLQRRLNCLSRRGLAARVALVLLDLLAAQGHKCRHGHELDLRLTHQDLADLAAASRPAVSALLVEWREAGWIGYTRQFICVEDMARLRLLAEE